jgi:hypothetical protein
MKWEGSSVAEVMCVCGRNEARATVVDHKCQWYATRRLINVIGEWRRRQMVSVCADTACVCIGILFVSPQITSNRRKEGSGVVPRTVWKKRQVRFLKQMVNL